MSNGINIAPNEAQILSQYLIGEKCSESTSGHYNKAVNQLNATLTDGQAQIWNKMLGSSVYMKLIDSGLVLTNPQSALRKRIFIMLTLLESSPDHVRYFLPQERSIWYLILLGFRAGLSAAYGIAGAMAVKLLKVN